MVGFRAPVGQDANRAHFPSEEKKTKPDHSKDPRTGSKAIGVFVAYSLAAGKLE